MSDVWDWWVDGVWGREKRFAEDREVLRKYATAVVDKHGAQLARDRTAKAFRVLNRIAQNPPSLADYILKENQVEILKDKNGVEFEVTNVCSDCGDERVVKLKKCVKDPLAIVQPFDCIETPSGFHFVTTGKAVRAELEIIQETNQGRHDRLSVDRICRIYRNGVEVYRR